MAARATFRPTFSVHPHEESIMRKLTWLLPAVALWIAPAGAAQGPFGRPRGPAVGPHIPGVPDVGVLFGRPPGIPRMPGPVDHFGRPRSSFDPTSPLTRPGLQGRTGNIDRWPD